MRTTEHSMELRDKVIQTHILAYKSVQNIIQVFGYSSEHCWIDRQQAEAASHHSGTA